MANVLLAWPNRIEKATSLTGGSYLETLPLANASNRVLAKKARTTDTLESSTRFECTFNEGRPVNVVAIAAHNLTTQAMWRIRLYAESAKITLVYDSGEIPVWPAIFNTSDLEWEYNNWWEGTISDDERTNYTPLASNISTNLNIALSMVVDIFDSSNPDGYIEFGRIFIGESFQPTINMRYGAQLGYEENTNIELTLSNNEYFDVKTPRRTASFQLDGLSKDEAFTKTYVMQRQQGIHSEVFFCYDPDIDQTMYLRTFLGRLKSIDPISQPYVDRYETSFNLIEIL
jgi:hypothetical protein